MSKMPAVSFCFASLLSDSLEEGGGGGERSSGLNHLAFQCLESYLYVFLDDKDLLSERLVRQAVIKERPF